MASQFGRYQIEREIGRGATGIVYLAFDPQLGQRVALKVLVIPLLQRKLFRREAARLRAAIPRHTRGVATPSERREPGRCHRTAQDVAPGGRDVESTHRFQPYGLMRSKCFQGSADTLSCRTCHDPHTNASTNTTQYEAACLRCHDPQSAIRVVGRPCPVNSRTGCIRCHMPARAVFGDKDLPVTMADHLIQVHDELRGTHGP